jgi:DNA-nicking Smr family endonuclease
MKPSRPPNEDDIRLFQDAVGPVRRIIDAPTIVLRPSPPAPEPLQFLKDEASVSSELLTSVIDAGEMEIGEELSYLKDGLSPRLLRRLKRGQFSVLDELDLHQMTLDVARSAIVQFLALSRRNGRLCVKIIHGKGLRSKSEGPVLKRLTDRMLRQRADVLAYASAKPAAGGTGAVIVLLRAP